MKSKATRAAFQAALRPIGELDLNEMFQRRANVMKSVPHYLKGPCRNAMRIMLEEIGSGVSATMFSVRTGRGRVMILPRLLLHRRCVGGNSGKEKLKQRFEAFLPVHQADLLARCTFDGYQKETESEPWNLEHAIFSLHASCSMFSTDVSRLMQISLPPPYFVWQRHRWPLRHDERAFASAPRQHLFFRVAELLVRVDVLEEWRRF